MAIKVDIFSTKKSVISTFDSVTQRHALDVFNGYIMAINKQGSLVEVKLRAINTMIRQCCSSKDASERELVKCLYEALAHRYPHWESSKGTFSDEKIKKIIMRMSIDRTLEIRSFSSEFNLKNLISANFKKIYCVIHPEKEVVNRSMNDVSGYVCSGCISDLSRAVSLGRIGSDVPVAKKIGFLRNQFLSRENETPKFKNETTNLRKRKVGSFEVKDESCEIHPDRPAAKDNKLSMGKFCRGCRICLGRALSQGKVRKSASPEEIREFLKERLGGV